MRADRSRSCCHASRPRTRVLDSPRARKSADIAVVTNVSRLGTRSLDDSGRMGLAGSIFASVTDDATADPATESIDARMASASETQSQTRRKDFLPSGTQRRPERASPARPLAQEGRLHTKSTLASTRNPRSDASTKTKCVTKLPRFECSYRLYILGGNFITADG